MKPLPFCACCAFLRLVSPALADDTDRIADAIRQAEGTWTYGIKSVRVHTEREARQICLNTIRHAWQDYVAALYERRRSQTAATDFIDFLADRYCPPSVDLRGNRNWKYNVRWILNHA